MDTGYLAEIARAIVEQKRKMDYRKSSNQIKDARRASVLRSRKKKKDSKSTYCWSSGIT